MRILFVVRGYPTENYPLNGVFEFDQAKALAALGHEVILAALDLRSIRRTRRWGAYRVVKDGVTIEALNLPFGNVPKTILHAVGKITLKQLYKTISRKYGQPDVIHSHFIEQGFLAVSALRNKGIPLIHTEHYSGMNQITLSDYYTRLGKLTYPNMTQILVVSKRLKNNLFEKFGVDSIVVPNIIDLSAFSGEIAPKAIPPFNFISVGGLTQNKRMDLLITAFSQAFKDDAQVNLYIYGEGPERKHIEDLINQYNMNDQIHLMGQQYRESIAKKMQESHCFVLFSVLETFGVAFIEAMSMGLPVISTRSGGPEDFINDKNGFIIEKSDVNTMALGLAYARENINMFQPEQISLRTKETFGPNSIIQKLVTIYQNQQH